MFLFFLELPSAASQNLEKRDAEKTSRSRTERMLGWLAPTAFGQPTRVRAVAVPHRELWLPK
jgi:hypothetical protein